MSWIGKYGVVGNSLGPTERFHGAMNEKGLSVTGLYLPDFTEYMTVSEDDNGNFITYVHLIDFVSSQFEYVEEVKAALAKIKVCDQKFRNLVMFPNLFTSQFMTNWDIAL